MSIRGRLRRFLPRRPRPAIIMYHRIHVPIRDPWNLAVTPENFRAQLKLLRRRNEILPLDKFVEGLRANRLSPRAVAITFDDGYRDNFLNAAPVLAEFDAPATFFLATGPMKRGQGYWWDRLAAMVLDAPAIDASARIGANDIAIALGPSEPDDLARSWRASRSPRTAREALYIRLWSLIRVLPPEEVEGAMETLAGTFLAAADPADAPMTSAEVLALLSSAPASLACHTVDHADLSIMDPDRVRTQLVRGKADVEALAGRKIAGFAYPFGRYNEAVVRLVQESGFAYACSSHNAPLDKCDSLALPRVTARDRASIDWLST